MPELHFTVGYGLDDLVRQAYWFEKRQAWALDTLGCLHGITEEQKMSVINGDAKLIPNEDGTLLQLVFEEDKEFKEKMREHEAWRNEFYINLGGKFITKNNVWQYVNFVVKQYRLMLKAPMMFSSNIELGLRMEDIRTGLHEYLMHEAGFTERSGKEYLNFACALDDLVDETEKRMGWMPSAYTPDSLKRELKTKFGEDFGRKRVVKEKDENDE